MFSIVRSIMLITVVVIIAVFVYYLIYARSINRKICNGQITNRKMVDIPKVIMIASIILLLLYSVALSVGLEQSYKNAAIVNRDDFSVIDLSDYSYCSYSGTKESNDASFAKIYSKESNEGYKKSVQRDGDFEFAVFIRTGDHDSFHPDFLCYVDYVGEAGAEFSIYGKSSYIEKESDKELFGKSSGGGSLSAGRLYIGNINDDENFMIRIGLLDKEAEQKYREAESRAYEEDNGEFPDIMDYARGGGSVTITID